MASKKRKVKAIEQDFQFLRGREEVVAILIFGSTTKGGRTRRSDVDICIVAPLAKDRERLLGEIYEKVDVVGKNYDVWIFEELPLYMKTRIIEKHEPVYVRDALGLHEYFYHFRKLWRDQRHRQRISKAEALRMLG